MWRVNTVFDIAATFDLGIITLAAACQDMQPSSVLLHSVNDRIKEVRSPHTLLVIFLRYYYTDQGDNARAACLPS